MSGTNELCCVGNSRRRFARTEVLTRPIVDDMIPLKEVEIMEENQINLSGYFPKRSLFPNSKTVCTPVVDSLLHCYC